MTHRICWRSAVTVSVIFHIFFLGTAGYLTARALSAPAIIEQYIELDLTNEPLAAPSAAQAETQAPPETVSHPVPPAPALRQPAPVVAATDHIPTAATVPAAAYSNETSNAPAAPAVSGNVSGNNSSSGKGGGVTPPSILSEVEATYPAAARQAGIEGTVFLKVQVLPNGRPGTIAVSQSSGHEMLDNAAVAAVRQWRFVPATERDSGRAIGCYITRPVSFRLN